MKYVDILLKRMDDRIVIGFYFRKDDKGTLKLVINDRGVGYVSGSSLFNEMMALGIDRKDYKKGFTAKEEEIDDKKIFVIEVLKK